MRSWPLLPMLVAAALGGCNAGPTGAEGLLYACEEDGDCIGGWSCAEGVCVQERALSDAGGGGSSCVPRVEQCGNGGDEDCDGKVDCDDPDCQKSLEVCDNGFDDDCDGLPDCAEPDCTGLSCGPFGLRCGGGLCACSGNGGPAEIREQTCWDGFDNDCDGFADCADPDCGHAQCGAHAAAVCCGSVCVDLSTSPSDCGGCGLSCKAGQACSPVITSTGTVSGRCGCATNNHCPAKQSCDAQSCACSSDGACAAGQRCSTTQGGAAPGYCLYPP